MSSSSDSLFGVGVTQILVAPGATNAQYIDMGARVSSLLIKYVSGGTLEIQPAMLGSTMPGASLAGLIGTGYIFGAGATGFAGEALSFDGPTKMYLMATGSTALAYLLAGRTTPGFNNLGS